MPDKHAQTTWQPMTQGIFTIPEVLLRRLTMGAAGAAGYLSNLAPEHSAELRNVTREVCAWVASGKAAPAPEVK